MIEARRTCTATPPPVTLVVLAAIVALVAAAAARAEYANPDGVAVIIGNRSYAGDLPAVDFAHRDAEAFRRYVLDVLGFDPENVIDLRDTTQADMWSTFGSRETADRSELWSYLADEGSDVVVFYSGHGVPDIDDQRGYLLPVDANPNTAELNGYPIDVLFENLANLESARSVAVYLDACFSGGSGGGMLIEGASPAFVEASLPGGDAERLTVLTAASGKQLASWDRKAKHGLFTLHLLEALYGKGDQDADGRVTAREAKAYLDRHMTRAAKRTWKRRQKASLMGNVDAVLANAGTGGAFPSRPVLDDAGAVAGPRERDAGRAGSARGAGDAPRPAETPEAVEAALGLTHAERVRAQHGLVALGHDVGAADGVFGRRTRTGVASYQRKKGLTETGYLTVELRDALVALGEAHQEEARRRAEAAAREAASRRAEKKREEEEAQRAESERRAAEQRRADDEVFARAKRLNTSASFQAYLDRGGRHEAEARELREKRRREEEEARAERERKAEERQRADDEAASRAKLLDTLTSYQEYLSSHPQGRHVEEVRRRIAPHLKAKWPAGKKFRDCGSCPEMVVVPAGSFMMGSTTDSYNGRSRKPLPVHEVTFSVPFAVGVYEVTRSEWSRFASETGYPEGRCVIIGNRSLQKGSSWRNPRIKQDDRHPVVCVSWRDAGRYVSWLSTKTEHSYRLLSESEWEYAARAGTTGPFHFGSKISSRRANYDARQPLRGGIKLFGKNRKRTVSVGSFRPNAFGLHDVHGNASEWVEDCWNEGYLGAPVNGSAWTHGGKCSSRVWRGGSWEHGAKMLVSSSRMSNPSGGRYNFLGFRVARALE